MNPELFPSIALKSDGQVLPMIITDTREQIPLLFTRLPSERGTLQSGDYSIKGFEDLFAVERKSIQDLVQSCGSERERFERELHRLRGFRFKRLLVCGHEVEIKTGRFRGAMSPKAILHSIAAFEVRYDLPIIWAGDAEHAARLVESWCWWFTREQINNLNELSKVSVCQEDLSLTAH